MKEEQVMRTSIVALALMVAIPVLARAENLSWQSDYTAAQQRAAAQQKPLAVVFGHGANGWQQFGGGALPAEANRTLSDSYVCCYVDTATPPGQMLARRFDITGNIGVVLSDRTGNLQAFWHEGTLSADALAGYLSKYADPQRTVSTTDTGLSATRTSLYPPFAYPGSFGPTAEPVCRT
jgi:hypothetical protein